MAKTRTRITKESKGKGVLGGLTTAQLLILMSPEWLITTIFVCKILWAARVPILAVLGAFVYIGYYGIPSPLEACVVATLAFLVYLAFAMANVWIRYRQGVSFTRLLIGVRRLWFLRMHRTYLFKACEIKDAPYPKIKKLRFNPIGVTFTMDVSKCAKTSLDIAVNGPEIAAALRAQEARVETPQPAKAIVQIAWGDPTSKLIRPGDIPNTDKKNELAFALDWGKQPVGWIINLSLLIIGRTRSGKSNIIWELINQLNIMGIPYRLRVIDPKGGVELSNLQHSPWCIDYAQTRDEITDVVDRAYDDMHERFAWMKKNGIREIKTPTEEHYLDLLIVDEMLHLDKYEAHSKFGLRLTQGSAALFVTVAMSQLSQVDVLGRVRDLFPQRICMGVDSPDVTDAALGQSAEKRGAKASQIPPHAAGVGYMYKDGAKGFVKFRAALIENDETDKISQGEPILATNDASWRPSWLAGGVHNVKSLFWKETAVYKLFNKYGRLLYVGIAIDPTRRFAQHHDKGWWPEVDMSQTEVEWYNRRKDAKRVETYLIKHEDPLYNKAESKRYKKGRDDDEDEAA